MTEFPPHIQFKYPWRTYQQRVLNELQGSLADKHLHVIAPPGSGKTVLGLEVALRINKPTLILAPTIVIRNQWIQRFHELFLQTTEIPDWISKDIRNPKFMTVVTYQGLHAACNNLKIDEETEDDSSGKCDSHKSLNINLKNIINGLKKQNIKTIVVDEAHHLRNEWWQTLSQVKQKLNPIIVGLTATPPYDVTATEWERYTDLNGLVDAEISVPELIIEGDLCPHQDYVYCTQPSEKEYRSIVEFRQNIETLFQEIRKDETIISAIESHPVWQDPTSHLDWIYDNIVYFSACIVFLNDNQKDIPETHLDIIGDKELQIPTLDYQWIETILNFYLYKEKEHFNEFEEHKTALENRLRRYGAIERNQINFLYSKRVSNYLTSSITKLDGIKEIVDFEHRKLDKNLRLVVLSDFIRKEFFSNDAELNKIGVIPIFEKLRRENNNNKKIGVLTGSIIIIPKTALPAFKEKAKNNGISQISVTPVSYDDNYVLINQTEHLKHSIVHLVTQIFQQGEIEVLIGTKSLLGEGWDAPAINSLVLASFVGSFVLSNQMRGRAIRVQNGNHNKTGNIWHLVCVDPTSPTGGRDFDLLKRRFKGFVGVSLKDEPVIENGINRINLFENIDSKQNIEKKNAEMFEIAADRDNLKHRWAKALENGVSLVEEIKIPYPATEKGEYQAIKSMYYTKTIANLVATLMFGIMGYLESILRGLARASRNIKTWQDLKIYLIFIGVGGVLFFGRQTYKTLQLYFKYRDIAKDIQKIGDALLNSMFKAKVIQTDISKLQVESSVDNWGAVYCHLKGGTTFEKSLFINSLQEIIAPIENPRYVIIRKSNFMLFIEQKDYHAVPEMLGRNKKFSEYFQNQWSKLVGNCDLIFTRTIEGRKLLLKSRAKSLAAQFEDSEVEHVNKWR